MFRIYLVLFFLCINFNHICSSESYAIILSTRAGDQKQSDIIKEYHLKTRQILTKAGFEKNCILEYFEKGNLSLPGTKEVIRKTILDDLKGLANKVKSDDKLWIFLYGHANFNTRGYSMATQGKRLKGKEFATALDFIKCDQIIFCFNRQGVALLPLLAKKSRIIISATNHIKQLNPPQLPKYLLPAWHQNIKNNILDLVKSSTDNLEMYFKENSLAVSEESQIFDGKINSYPPYDDINDGVVKKTILKVNKKTIAKLIPKKEIINGLPELQKPTKITISKITQAQKSFMYYNVYDAYYKKDYQSFLVNKDLETLHSYDQEIYIGNTSAVEKFKRKQYMDGRPYNETNFKIVRVIYPDGSYRDYLGSKFIQKKLSLEVNLPKLTKGCLIVLNYTQEVKPRYQIPFFTKSIFLQSLYPKDDFKLTLRYPKDKEYFYKPYHIKLTSIVKTEGYSKVIEYDSHKIPAWEILPYDAPTKESMMMVGLTSLKDWNAFVKWVDSITEGADALDEISKKMAIDLTKGAKTDTDKVKAIYDFLCELRYVTTPIGVRAFRPRLPSKVCESRFGDCKDKANALVAMAGHVGVKGYFVLLNRMSSTDKDFPSWQFNHALAFFPKLKGFGKGLWLDATDGSTPFGTLPMGDINRDGLLLLKPGCKFKRVTSSKINKNKILQKIVLTRNSTGIVKGTINQVTSGFLDYQWKQKLKRKTPLQREYFLQSELDKWINQCDLKSYTMSDLLDLNKKLDLNIMIESQYLELTLNKLLLPYFQLEPFRMVKRSKTIKFNDGQPFEVEQHIKIVGVELKFPERKKEIVSKWFDVFVEYTKGSNQWSRVVHLNFKSTSINSNEYEEVRKKLQLLTKELFYHQLGPQ
ncbi:MAG: hypothetical protein COA79_14435 [Planctomycetota bacterium]|nr:MAG: hypothetical protein COA79_14435 [Planctomycetota bacterium]